MTRTAFLNAKLFRITHSDLHSGLYYIIPLIGAKIIIGK